MAAELRAFLIALVLAGLSPATGLAAGPQAPPERPGPMAIVDAAHATAQGLKGAYARADALIDIAATYAELGADQEASEAILAARDAAAETPMADHLRLAAGEACVRAGLHRDAIRVVDRITYAPHAVHVLFQMAAAHLEAGRRGEALAALRRAAEAAAGVEPGEPAARAWARIATLYGEAGIEADFNAAIRTALAEARNEAAPLRQSVAVEHAAEALLETGRLEQALSTAWAAPVAEVAVKASCDIAEAFAEAGDPVRAAEVLQAAGEAARSVREPTRRVGMLSRIAASCRAIGRRDMLEETLSEAVTAMHRVADPSRRTAARDKLVTAYAAAGELDTAERVAAEQGQGGRLARQMLDLAVRHVERGQYGEAVRLAESVEPRYRQLAGSGRLASIGLAYRELWGIDAPVHRLMGVQPNEVRDAVLSSYAEALADRGAYEDAVGLAERIAFALTRDDAFLQIARKCLAKAGSTEEAQVAVGILERLTSPLDKLRLRALLAGKEAALGRHAEALDSLRELDRDVRQAQPPSARSELLRMMAMDLLALGRKEEARQTAVRAVAAAMQEGCASCRDSIIEELFELLSGPAYVELAVEAGSRIELPHMRAENSLRMIEMAAGLSLAQREVLLREALLAATEVEKPALRVGLLLRVARGYHGAGLRLTGPEVTALRAAVARPPLPAREAPASPARELRRGRPGVAQLVYFDRPGCPLCDEVKASFDELKGMFPGLVLRTLNLADPEATRLNMAICEALDLPEQQRLVAPSVFSARAGLVGSEISLSTMAELAETARGLPSPVLAHGGAGPEAGRAIQRLYEGLRLPVVVTAGLVDGVNPCAFAVIIFFLAYLAHIGRDRRQIAAAGVVFTAAVFVTYFAIGAGLAGLLSAAADWSGAVQKGIYALTAVLALLAAALSLRDGFRAMAGRTTELTLKLPEALQSRIRRSISRRARMGLTVAATAVLGGAVALFEFPCTGQVYAPVIVYVLQHSRGRFWGPLGWLLVYNACFIAPLVAVFVAVLFGLTSQRLTAWFRRHLAAAKFAMAALFAALGAFMVSYLI